VISTTTKVGTTMTKQLGSAGLVALAALLLSACGAPPEPGPARGAQLFDTCVPCHGVTGGGNASLGAPSIAGMQEWYAEAQIKKFQDGRRGSHPDDAGGLRMRPMARTLMLDGDISSVLQHLAAMPNQKGPATVTGDAAAGKAKYMVCTACHGADGAGNEAMKAPSLIDKDDWYLVSQIAKFKDGVRGRAPGDVTGAQMAPMAATLTDEQAINDVVAYIQTLSKQQ